MQSTMTITELLRSLKFYGAVVQQQASRKHPIWGTQAAGDNHQVEAHLWFSSNLAGFRASGERLVEQDLQVGFNSELTTHIKSQVLCIFVILSRNVTTPEREGLNQMWIGGFTFAAVLSLLQFSNLQIFCVLLIEHSSLRSMFHKLCESALHNL